jgi:hypothetical protein
VDISSREAKIIGKDIANDTRDATITGKETANSERNARIIGKTSYNVRTAVITGGLVSDSERTPPNR